MTSADFMLGSCCFHAGLKKDSEILQIEIQMASVDFMFSCWIHSLKLQEEGFKKSL